MSLDAPIGSSAMAKIYTSDEGHLDDCQNI